MINSQLVTLLKSLSAAEIKRFKEYVHSPFFNHLKHVSELFNLLKKYYPDFNQKHCNKEYIYAKIYKGEKYDDVKLRKLFSQLLQLAEEFLTYNKYMENPFETHRYLLQALNEKHLDSLFKKSYNAVCTQLEKTYRDEKYYYYKSTFDFELHKYNITKTPVGKRSGLYEKFYNDNLKNSVNSLVIQIFKSYCQALNNKRGLNFELDIAPQRFLIDIVTNLSLQDNFYIDLYHRLLHLYMGIDALNNANEIVKIVINNRNKINPYDSVNLLMEIRNFYTGFIFLENKQEFVKSAHEIDKEILKNPCCFMDNGYLPASHFMSIIDFALILNNLEWVEKFINVYRKKLNPVTRTEIYNFCLARFYYHQKNYAGALKILSQTKLKDSELYLRIGNLKIMLLYELNYIDEIIRLIDSIKHFLRDRITIPEIDRRRLMAFYKYSLKICSFKENPDYDSISYIKNKILNSNPIYNKKWLIEKIEELAE